MSDDIAKRLLRDIAYGGIHPAHRNKPRAGFDPTPTMIVCPYVAGKLARPTQEALAMWPAPITWCQLPTDDHGAYGRLFRDLWRRGETFVICEQDIVPTVDQLAEISTCGHDWCYYGYDDNLYPEGPMFGLVRFDGRVMAEHPDAADRALSGSDGAGWQAPWWHVDSLVCRDLTIRLARPAPEGDGPDAQEWARHPWKRAGCVTHLPPVHHAHVGPPSGPQ